MKNFMTLIAILAIATFTSCKGVEEANWYGDYPDDAEAQNDSEASDQTDTVDSDAQGDTDLNDTENPDTTDSGADTTDSGADTTDSGADTTDSGADTTDSGADTTDSGADTTDSGADTTDSGADTTDSGADTTDSGADTTDSGADTTDSGADTTDSGADTTDTTDTTDTADTADTADSGDDGDTGDDADTLPVCVPDCTDKLCGDDADGCGGSCGNPCGADEFCNYEYRCIPTECATVTEIELTSALALDNNAPYSSQSAVFKTTYAPNTGSSAADTFFVKFSNLDEYKGVFYLEDKNFDDESGFFLYVKEDGGEKIYFQKDGTVETDYNDEDDGWTETETISVKFTGVMLEEVTINSSNHSTSVQGGACLNLKNTTIEFEKSDQTYSWFYDLLDALFDGWN